MGLNTRTMLWIQRFLMFRNGEKRNYVASGRWHFYSSTEQIFKNKNSLLLFKMILYLKKKKSQFKRGFQPNCLGKFMKLCFPISPSHFKEIQYPLLSWTLANQGLMRMHRASIQPMWTPESVLFHIQKVHRVHKSYVHYLSDLCNRQLFLRNY